MSAAAVSTSSIDATPVWTALRLARFAAAFSVVGGVVVFAGWAFDIPQARSLVPGTVSMKANTALAFVCFGVGLWLVARSRPGERAGGAGRLLGAVVAAVGILTLCEYAFGVNLGFDELMFIDRDATATSHPGRLSPLTAVAFTAAGSALAFIDARPRGRWPAGYLAAVSGGIGYLSILGYALGVGSLFRIGTLNAIAVHTSISLLVVSFGIMALRPDRGLGRLLYHPGPGPLLFRRLLPVAFVITPVFAFLRLGGERAGLYPTEVGVTIFTLAMVAAICGVLLWSARSLDAVDAERREADTIARAARAEADAANRAKSEFLSRMSHELRTPLNSVLGFAQLLGRDHLNDEQRESVEQITRAGRHLLDLINEVLDLSRIETGQLNMSLEPVDVRATVTDAIALIGPLAASWGIAVLADEIAPDQHVLADRQRLRQVLLNLLANAVKYSPPGSMTTVLTERAGDGRIRITVADTGPGIGREMLSRLFMPFDRLGAEATAVEGTGLGLALSRALVEAMGGTIGVDSTVGVGSRFWVELPETAPVAPRHEVGADVAAESPPPAAIAPGTAAAGTVLYVEDNLSNFRLVERALKRRREVHLIPAMLGRLGLDLAREHHPDLVLLDLHLPDIPGEELLGRLRADPATRAIPVVILSADATPGQVERLLADGARAYLTKPLDIGALLALVDDVLAPDGEA